MVGNDRDGNEKEETEAERETGRDRQVKKF